MKAYAILAMSAASIALVACNNKADDTPATELNTMATNDAAMNGDVGATVTAAAPMSAQGFANAAAASDRFEVETSRLASASGQSAAVKKFADNMIKAHTASTAELKTILGGLPTPVIPNDALNADQQRLMDGLQGKSGADLDKAYSAAQVTAHQATLDALKAYADGGDTQALKAFANKMVPTVTAHLNAAKGLK